MKVLRYQDDDSKKVWVLILAIIALALLVIKFYRELKKLRKQIKEVDAWR